MTMYNIAAHKTFKNTAIYNVYGLSEAGPRVTAWCSNCCENNSVSKPINGIEIEIVNNKGIPQKAGECRIVHVNTPSLFDGYIIGKKAVSLYKDWLNTGDIGYLDSGGNLFYYWTLW